jgi:hypothetical protein
MRVYYSTDTRSNSKSTSGDQRNGSLVPIGNEPNGEANKKNKDSIFISVCSVDSLKSAYSQIKSNPGMLTPGNAKETLQNISEEWFTRTSKLLLTHKYDFGTKKRFIFQNQVNLKKQDRFLFLILEIKLLKDPF